MIQGKNLNFFSNDTDKSAYDYVNYVLLHLEGAAPQTKIEHVLCTISKLSTLFFENN